LVVVKERSGWEEKLSLLQSRITKEENSRDNTGKNKNSDRYYIRCLLNNQSKIGEKRGEAYANSDT
jgi:hypothetical protein